MTKTVTSRTIAVEHIRISSQRPFAEVRRRLEGAVPRLDASIAAALASGDQKRAKDYEEKRAQALDLPVRNHGVLLEIAGNRRNALQYEIGNGFSASNPRLPVGGVKKRGYGCELSHFGLREFVNAQDVWIKETSTSPGEVFAKQRAASATSEAHNLA